MARNPNVTKMRLQRFRKRRGAFLPGSDPSSLDNKFADPKLQKFWAERTTPRTMSVSRAQVPAEYEGLMDYRQRGATPSAPTWLDTLFPGVQMRSEERAAAEKRISEMMEGESDPYSAIVVERTQRTQILLYYTVRKDAWWFVYVQEITSCRVLKTSIRYPSKDRALAVRQTDTIRWFKQRTFSS